MSTQQTGGFASEELLSAYLDGECDAAELAWVEAALRDSAELRAVLDDVTAARAAVRSLPARDAPPEFWARLLAADADGVAGRAEERAEGRAEERAEEVGSAPVVLADRRQRRAGRWLAAAGGAAAAAVIAAIVFVPQPEAVDPPVATFTDAHAVRSSLQSEAVSTLAPLAVQAGFGR